MTESLFRPERLVTLFGVCVVVAIVVSAGTTSAAFSPFNGNWEGASGLQTVAEEAGADSDVVLSTDAYGAVAPVGTVAVIVSPDRRYSQADVAAVETFVRNGGTLLVAEDFGPHSNPLLASLGARSRIDGRLVVDEAVYHRSPTMPVARPEVQSGLLVGVEAFTLNHGSYVDSNGASVLVQSSEFSTLETDNGNVVETSVGPYPLVTVEPVGSGTVIVLSDSSALINAMLERPGNAAFVHNVFVRHDRVLLDYSHSEHVPPLDQALSALDSLPVLQVGLGVGVVVLTGLLATRLGTRRAHRSAGGGLGGVTNSPPTLSQDRSDTSQPAIDHATLVAHLQARHPEWDPERTERLARAVRSLSGVVDDE